MFRGKESSNRIELSRLVQDLLNFGVLGSLWLWGGGRWVGGIWGHGGGCPHTHAHAMCMHAHAHTHIYTCVELQMAADMEAFMFSMFSMYNMHVRTCVCMCVHACMHETPPTHPCQPPPPSTHLPPPPGGWTPGIT